MVSYIWSLLADSQYSSVIWSYTNDCYAMRLRLPEHPRDAFVATASCSITAIPSNWHLCRLISHSSLQMLFRGGEISKWRFACIGCLATRLSRPSLSSSLGRSVGIWTSWSTNKLVSRHIHTPTYTRKRKSTHINTRSRAHIHTHAHRSTHIHTLKTLRTNIQTLVFI